jgi:phospholipid/cholesterol/gamma-HCH transport system permease protein
LRERRDETGRAEIERGAIDLTEADAGVNALGYIRAQSRDAAMWYGGLGLLAMSVARNLALPPAYLWIVAREIDIIGVRSLVVAVTAALFTGMVLALQSAVNMARFGAENYVGPVVALSILRELGPVLTAILVGGKVASGITAELGSMKVTEQIDALRAIGVNHIKRLIVPRLLAALLVFPVVTVLADGVGLVGGMLISVFDRNVDAYLYWNTISYWVVLKDFLTGVIKSVVFGAIVTLIGCYNGLATEGGTEGLGRSTTATVVQVAMGVIVSDFFLTKLLLFLFW